MFNIEGIVRDVWAPGNVVCVVGFYIRTHNSAR